MSIIQGTSKAAGGGYTIAQSIRFDKTTSSHLSKTYGSAGNRRTWTFSTWFKRGKIDGSRQVLFAATGQAYLQLGPDAASREMITILNEGTGVDLNWYTTAVYRDPSAWYHLVWQFDSTQATADNRTKLYINGVQVTDFTKAATPDLNLEGAINNNVEHKIGEGHIANFYYDGYQAEIYFIDGQALDATSFGQVDSATGQWVPIAYSGSYGTNGFYITGEDSADLGADYSGNGNDFTSSGLTSADQVTDTPTANWSTWNPTSGTWIYPATFSDGNLTAIRSGSGTNIVGSTISFPATGNWYAEFTIDATGSSSHIWQVGIIEVDDAERFDTVEPRLGQGAKGYAYTTNWSGSPVPSKQNNNSAVSYGTLGTATDVIGVHLNNGTLVFYHNNVSQGTAYSGITGEYIFAWSGQGGAQVTANFGQKGFAYTPPSSAVAVTTANLPDPTIADPSAHFQTTVYTGNGTAIGSGGLEVNQSGNSTFQPDFAWIKNRTTSGNEHDLYDAVRGATKVIFSSTTGAEATVSEGLASFDTDGFTVGNRGEVNTSGNSMVAWQWKANGSGSSNTDGDVTSTVSANTTSGFSIVTYTPGTGVHTWGHGLGVAPSMVIVKDRGEVTNWLVYHSAVGPTKKILLNTSDLPATDSGIWNNTAPTSSVVTTGSGLNDAHSFVAYCFAEVDGFSKAGSYVANASTDGPFVYCGFRPAWVIFFITAGTGAGRSILDSVRDPYNPEDSLLQANTTAVESSGSSYYTDFVSNGFKLRTSSDFNGSGRTVAYMAFAESPFKAATAR